MIIPEILIHEKRLPRNQLDQLQSYAEKNHWTTKDFHQITQELEEFIHNLSPLSQNMNELWFILAKLLFYAGNLLKLNDIYTSVAAVNQEIFGVQIYYALGLAFQGYTDEALRILEPITHEIKDDSVILMESLGIILFVYSIKRDLQRVDELYNEIIHLSETLSGLTERMKAHLLPLAYIRKAYSIRGQKSNALELLKKCQNQLNIFPHRFFQVMTTLRMGHIYHINGNHSTALELYDQAIDLANEIQTWHFLSIIYNRIGFIMNVKRELNLAKEYFQRSLKYANKSGAKWLTVGPLANLVQWKLSQGKIHEAIEDYHTFASITETIGDEQELFYAFMALAELYEQIDDIPKSKYYLTKGISLGLKLGIFHISRI